MKNPNANPNYVSEVKMGKSLKKFTYYCGWYKFYKKQVIRSDRHNTKIMLKTA